jgi:uncharacterized protein (DUF58 family)
VRKIPNPKTYLLGFVKHRFQSWWQARLPLADQISLTQRNVYILPTGPGLMLGVTLFVLLIASINYQLSLGYALTFLLAGSAIIGMHVGHGTLRGLSLSVGPPNAQFAGSPVQINIRLNNPDKSIRYGLGLSLQAQQDSPNSPTKRSFCDVPAQGSSTLQLAWTASQRGLQRLPTMTLETRFPLGSFRIWAHWRPAAQVMIYPQPEASPPALPIGLDSHENGPTARVKNNGEFDAIRNYRRGDALKQVIWKKAAKANAQGNGLVVRDTLQAQQTELWLDLNQTSHSQLGAEDRISRLCAWVLAAQAQDLSYGLRLPGLEIKPASGAAQQRRCLEALALC